MTTIVQKLRRPQYFSLLLLVILAMAVISWRFADLNPAPSTTNLADSYFSNNISRTGATTDRMINTLQQRLKTFPEDGPSYSQLGLAYLQKAREIGDPTYYQKVDEALHKALSINPGDDTAINAMGALALARHQFASALEWGERARQQNPNRTYAHGIIADAEIELGQYPQAVKTLQTMVDTRPDMSSYTRISYIRELYGKPGKAIEIMQWAVDAGGPQAENTAWTRTQLGNLYFNQGNLRQAESEYQQTLSGLPGYVYALAGLGRVRAAQGKMDEAVTLLTQASQKMPLPDFIISLADVYHVTGQEEAAQREYDLLHVIQKLFEANGVDLDLEIALFNADHGFDRAGTFDLASKAYTRRPSIYGADVLAWTLYQQGEYQKAQTYSQKALHLGTQDALKLFHAGMISYRLGDREKAQGYLEQALTINPYFSILYQEEAKHTLDILRAGAPTPTKK